MSGRTAYLDTTALARYLRRWPARASAAVLRAEALRALGRIGQPQASAARQLFGGLHLISLDEQLLDRAGELRPWTVRSVDAVHLAAALALGSDLGVLVTYD